MRYIYIMPLVLLCSCNWIGSANYSYSESWQQKSCDPERILELEKEYKEKSKEYEKKFSESSGRVRCEEKEMGKCRSFFVGYSKEMRMDKGIDRDERDGLKEIRKDVIGR